MTNERHQEILRIVAARRRASVGELAERLGVSEVTIRKDLADLEDAALLQRTRGGAVPAQDLAEPNTIQRRRGRAVVAKRAIARTAAPLVQEGETIFVDSGSTCAALAAELRGRSVNVVTNSLDVLNVLSGAEATSVYCLGGRFRHDAASFVGPGALSALADLHVDIAFLGTTGFSFEGELASQNAFESEVKRGALQHASRAMVLADAGKFGTHAFSVFARCTELDAVVTDGRPAEHPFLRELAVEVISAGPDEEHNSEEQR
jgi:DeoR/GlpR family transcriptional regulator of sugar metabolism